MGCFLSGILIFFILAMFGASTEAGVITLIIVVFVFLWLAKQGSKSEAEEKRKRLEREKEVNQEVSIKMEELGFSIAQRFDDVLHANQYKFLAIDENGKKVALVEDGNYRIFGYRDILESEIIVDGQEMTRTSRTSQVGRALVGGLVAGGVGAIIGGVGAKQEHKSEVKNIQLKIVVNDTKEPSFILDFLKLEILQKHVTKEDSKYKNAMNQATKLHDIISVLIRQADEVDRQDNNETSSQLSSSSVAEELERLYGLVEKGILTQEEYEIQKQKLLNR
jgi:hypothetical protein